MSHLDRARFIPVLNTTAGLTLTTLQWQELGCDVGAYSLESLLFKPGYDALLRCVDLKRYLNCPGTLILNARSLQVNKAGVFRLHSPFDGQVIVLSYAQLIDLIVHLKPDMVLFPAHVLRDAAALLVNWSEAIIPYFFVDDVQNERPLMSHGVYVSDEHSQLSAVCCTNGAHPLYVCGLSRSAHGAWFESNQPAQDGLDGIVYGPHGVIDLNNKACATCFELIDEQCICPTCTARLTQAYLHHLYEHTPLLAQRFLIQHNVFSVMQLL